MTWNKQSSTVLAILNQKLCFQIVTVRVPTSNHSPYCLKTVHCSFREIWKVWLIHSMQVPNLPASARAGGHDRRYLWSAAVLKTTRRNSYKGFCALLTVSSSNLGLYHVLPKFGFHATPCTFLLSLDGPWYSPRLTEVVGSLGFLPKHICLNLFPRGFVYEPLDLFSIIRISEQVRTQPRGIQPRDGNGIPESMIFGSYHLTSQQLDWLNTYTYLRQIHLMSLHGRERQYQMRSA